LKYRNGVIDDESYDFKDLAVGKPQLYRVCPPPPRAQWTYDADRDGRDRRDGHDRRGGRDGHDRHEGRGEQWQPQPPIDPPRVRSLTQEQDIRSEHEKALRGRGH
jgi:hypothetical protein